MDPEITQLFNLIVAALTGYGLALLQNRNTQKKAFLITKLENLYFPMYQILKPYLKFATISETVMFNENTLKPNAEQIFENIMELMNSHENLADQKTLFLFESAKQHRGEPSFYDHVVKLYYDTVIYYFKLRRKYYNPTRFFSFEWFSYLWPRNLPEFKNQSLSAKLIRFVDILGPVFLKYFIWMISIYFIVSLFVILIKFHPYIYLR